jgi:hypothetical protein
MTTPSDFAGKACEGQTLKPAPFTELTTKYNDFLTSLKLNQCVIDTTKFTTEESSSSFLFGGYDDKSENDTSHKAGCSGVNALLQTYNNAVQNVKCIISEDTTNVTVKVAAGNKIRINVGGNFVSNCPINQTISGAVNLYTEISNTSSANIKTALDNHIQSFTNQLQNMYNGQPQYNEDGEGTQNVNQILQSSTQNDINNQIDDRITTFNKSILENQTYTLNVGGNLTLFAGSGMCGSITQSIQLDIVSASIVQGAFTAALKNVDVSSLLPPLPYTPPVVVAKKSTPIINYIIVLLIVAAILGGIYWFYIRKNKSKNFLHY